MNIFLTGATGYVGLNLVHYLQNTDHEITALVRPGSRTDRLPNSVTTVKGDITDRDSLQQGIKGQEAVIHLAALLEGNSKKIDRVNVKGTENIATIAEQENVEQLVFISTINAHPDIPRSAITKYEQSKQDAEESLREYNVNSTVIYPTYIWGPRDFKLTRYHYIQKVESNLILIPPFYAQRNFNIVHVNDVCQTIADNLSGSPDSRIMVTGKNISAKQLYRKLSDYKEGFCAVVAIPKLLTHSSRPIINILNKKGYFPIAGDKLLSSTDIGTVPERYESTGPNKQKSVSQAIEDTYKWYRNIGLVNSDLE